MPFIKASPAPKSSARKSWRRFQVLSYCLVAALLALTPWRPPPHAQIQSSLPDLGDQSASILSGVEEEQLGREFMRDARRRFHFVEEPELLAYLSRLGNRLAQRSDNPSQTFRFYMIEDNTLNAFAVPGGHVSVHTGLINTARNEDELAGVMAHEIAHVTQRHLPRMLSKVSQQQIPALAGLLAAILLGGQAGQAALVATQAKLAENQLSYSRGFEREADALGIKTLARAGYDPRGMPSFFERMQQWARIYDSNVPEFLRTHPLTSDRIAESNTGAEAYPVPKIGRDQTDFFHIRAKIRALYVGSADDAVTTFRANLRDQRYEHENAQRYGLVLALTRAKALPEARQQADLLINTDPESLRYLIARGDIEMTAHRYSEGLEYYERARRAHPDSILLAPHYANALIHNQRYAEARQLLRKASRHNPNDPLLQQLLARAEGKAGNSLEAHRALAEYHYLRGDLSEAVRQLAQAKRYVGDSFYTRASVEARIQAIQREMEAGGKKSKTTQR